MKYKLDDIIDIKPGDDSEWVSVHPILGIRCYERFTPTVYYTYGFIRLGTELVKVNGVELHSRPNTWAVLKEHYLLDRHPVDKATYESYRPSASNRAITPTTNVHAHVYTKYVGSTSSYYRCTKCSIVRPLPTSDY